MEDKMKKIKTIEKFLKENFKKQQMTDDKSKMAFAIGYLKSDEKVNKEETLLIMKHILCGEI